MTTDLVGGGGSSAVDQDYPLAPVPAAARKSLGSLVAVLLGFTFFTPTMFAGADLGAAFSFGNLITVILAGSVILGAYVAAIAAIGASTGLTTVLLSRYTLGRLGAKWADLILGGTQLGWYAFTAAIVAVIMSSAFGWESGLVPLIILLSVLMGITAFFGYRGMQVLSVISVPLMAILCFWVAFRALSDVGGFEGLIAVEGAGSGAIGWGGAVTIVVGTFASGGTQVANWSRFARNTKHATWAALVAFLVTNGIMLAFGALGGLVYQQADFVDVLIAQGLITWGVVLLILNNWTTNDNAAYAFGVAGAEFFDRPSKRPFIVGGVAIATVLAATGVYDLLPQYLVLLGVFIPPLGGAIIGDHLFTWRKHRLPSFEEAWIPNVRWAAVVAYLLGTAAAYFGNRAGIGIPPLQGILVALVGIPVFDRLFSAFGIDQRPRPMHEVGDRAAS
jgi:cytosine permease